MDSTLEKSMKLEYVPVVNVKAVRGKTGNKNDVKSAVWRLQNILLKILIIYQII